MQVSGPSTRQVAALAYQQQAMIAARPDEKLPEVAEDKVSLSAIARRLSHQPQAAREEAAARIPVLAVASRFPMEWTAAQTEEQRQALFRRYQALDRQDSALA